MKMQAVKYHTDKTTAEKFAKSMSRLKSLASRKKLSKMLSTTQLLISRKEQQQLFFLSCLIPLTN